MGRSRSGLQGILTEVARAAAGMCEAKDCLIFLVEDDHFRLVAQHGALRYAMAEKRPLNRRSALGRAIVEQRTVHVRDMHAAARQFPDAVPAARITGVRMVVATPLLRDRAVVGGIVIRRTVVRPFTPKQVSLLKTFADQAAVAIENARLSGELAARNRELTTALERETATGEILRVISRSPTDTEPVFNTLLESACRLCEATIRGHLVRAERGRRQGVRGGGRRLRLQALQPTRVAGEGQGIPAVALAASGRGTLHQVDEHAAQALAPEERDPRPP